MKLSLEWEDATLDSFRDNPELVEQCRKFIQQDQGFLFIFGPQGVGKTHLAVGTLREIDKRNPTLIPSREGNIWVDGVFTVGQVKVTRLRHKRLPAQTEFTTVADMVHELRSSIRRRPRSMAQEFGLGKEDIALSMDEILDKYMDVHALVLDDLGAGRDTDFTFDNLYTIISNRYSYRAKRATIVTSNLNLNSIEKKFDPRLASRLGAGTVVYVAGTDYRKSLKD